MSYKEKPLLKIYRFENNAFKQIAIIDDYETCSFQRNKFEAGQFSIQINYNIPNSQIFQSGLFVQFGNDSKDFGLIKKISDAIGPDGKGSQVRTITGYDARILFKQRIIKNLNFSDSWTFTGSGELCMRNLINSQCGSEAETKRRLPITNTIGGTGIGSDYTVSEAFSNLYDVLVTIATQTEIGWGVEFINQAMSLYFYAGVDRHSTVRFDTDYNSLANGSYEDGTENYANSVYVGGKGSGENRDLYEGETGDSSPSGLDRYEAFDNASSLENDDEYENEAKSKLNEYSNTISLSGNGLAKCPYEYKKEYDVGDIITVSFSGKSAIAQILSITEHWAWGQYDLQFEFGKPIPSLNRQLSYLLSKIQTYQATADSVKKSDIKYYNIPDELEQPNQDVILDVIGFTGNMGEGVTFKLFFDNDSKVGAKTYHLYFKTLAGTGKLKLTSGVSGATDLELGGGTYVAIIYVDENGNIGKVTGTSNYSELEGTPNLQPVATTGSYSDLTGKPSIPTKTSDLTNDSNFVNTTQLNGALTNYLSKSSLIPNQQNYNVNGYFKFAHKQVYGRTANFKIVIGTNAIELVLYRADGTMEVSAFQEGKTLRADLYQFGYDNTYIYIHKTNNFLPGLSIQIYSLTSYNEPVGAIEASTEAEFNASTKISISDFANCINSASYSLSSNVDTRLKTNGGQFTYLIVINSYNSWGYGLFIVQGYGNDSSQGRWTVTKLTPNSSSVTVTLDSSGKNEIVVNSTATSLSLKVVSLLGSLPTKV